MTTCDSTANEYVALIQNEIPYDRHHTHWPPLFDLAVIIVLNVFFFNHASNYFIHAIPLFLEVLSIRLILPMQMQTYTY